jgi:predicted transcriptional regulator
MHNTKVSELMTQSPVLIGLSDTLVEAAQMMKETECGSLPVGAMDNLRGIITDRDIILRAIAEGKNPAQEKVQDYMTNEVFACNEDDLLEDAAQKMREHKVGRLVVRDHQGRVTGILSFGGILRKDANAEEVSNIVQHATQRVVA